MCQNLKDNRKKRTEREKCVDSFRMNDRKKRTDAAEQSLVESERAQEEGDSWRSGRSYKLLICLSHLSHVQRIKKKTLTLHFLNYIKTHVEGTLVGVLILPSCWPHVIRSLETYVKQGENSWEWIWVKSFMCKGLRNIKQWQCQKYPRQEFQQPEEELLTKKNKTWLIVESQQQLV